MSEPSESTQVVGEVCRGFHFILQAFAKQPGFDLEKFKADLDGVLEYLESSDGENEITAEIVKTATHYEGAHEES